jgi:hypothetical protein
MLLLIPVGDIEAVLFVTVVWKSGVHSNVHHITCSSKLAHWLHQVNALLLLDHLALFSAGVVTLHSSHVVVFSALVQVVYLWSRMQFIRSHSLVPLWIMDHNLRDSSAHTQVYSLSYTLTASP